MQPITFAPRPRLTCSYYDLRDAWGKIHPIYGMDKARGGYGVANLVGPPNILFIGSSHIDHMRYLQPIHADFPSLPKWFISSSVFAGVGGLKWWLVDTELYGSFRDPRKAQKYGNQWEQFESNHTTPDAAVFINGSNDTDDFHSHDFKLRHDLSKEDYVMQSAIDMELWLAQLCPVIEKTITNISHDLSRTKLYYIPIIPRSYWNKPARDFGNKLDYYIKKTLSREHNITVNALELPSLFKNKCTTYKYIYQDVIPGFLQSDNLHLNQWGYEALIRDLTVPIMDFVGAKRTNGTAGSDLIFST